MSQKETMDLKKELEFRRRQIVKLEQELKDRDQKMIDLEHLNRKYEEENRQAHQTLINLDKIVEERAQRAADVEKEKYRKLVDEMSIKNEDLRRDIERLQIDKKLLKDKESEIDFLNAKIKEIAGGNGNLDAIKDIRGEKNDNLALKREVEKLTKDWTTLSNQMEDILSENRVLREMAGVPENYGFNLQDIKLVEKQKIEEYRGRIRRLEEEVEELEKERTDLRYKLRNLSTLYGEKGLRFHQLTADQMRMVDEFAQNLRDGRVDLPLNDRSKELLHEIEKLRAQLQILEAHSFGGKASDSGLSDQVLEQIRLENKELKDLLMKLYSGMSTTSDERATVSRHILQLPPVPISDPMGEFHEGYSYRFGSKMPVAEIWTGEPKRDLSALQLQIVELLELVSRRDEDDKLTALELEEFRNKLREILLVQEELYKQYAKEAVKWKEDRLHLQNQYETALQELREARAQVGVYEDMAKTIQTNSPNVDRSKLSEYASRIALLEVNNLRLARKYDCLQSEEKDLRLAYHAFEAEHAEKDVLVQKKIGMLKEWRISATYQLQFLFKQLRQSVPFDRYDMIEHQLDIAQEKMADWVVREADLYKRLSKYENMERENLLLNDKLKDFEDLKIDVEAELEMVSRRLEHYDNNFRVEQAVLRRVVEHLKAKFISPESAFALFDKNKDGKISRAEFRSALENIGIRLMPAEVDAVVRSIDTDLDGSVKYTEFIRKMKIYGVQPMSEEQQIIQNIYQSIKKLNYTLYDVFTIFDRDNDGQVSRKDLMDSFNNFGLGLTVQQIEKVLKLIDTNRDGQIEFSEFSKVFERELELKPQEKKQISLDWKDELFARINGAIKKYNLDLNEAFSAFDENRDGRISKSEFIQAFNKMEAGLTRQQLDELWNSMNNDRDGFISYVEFISQFKNSVRERDTYNVIKEAEVAVQHTSNEYGSGLGRQDRRQTAVFEAREQAALNKAERYQIRMKSLENSLSDAEKQIAILEQKYLELTKKYHIVREDDATNQNRLANTVSKAEAERLKQNNEMLQKELAEARAAMNTYKSIVGVSADHVRALQLTLEKRKDEIDTFQRAIRELQADSPEAATVGKLYHQVMVSRWSEASANRKYDSLLNEARNLRTEAFRLESESMDREKSIYDLQQVLTEKITNYESQIRELKLKAEHNISLDKANEFVAQIRDLGEKKSELEDETRKLRSEALELEGKVEEAKIMKNAAEEIYQLIKTGSSDEVSDRLVDMAERMSTIRLSELKSKRESAHSKEKEEYYARIHVQEADHIRTLEQEVARWESVLAKKEEAWRKKDDERQKMLLNPKFQIQTSEAFQPRLTPGEVKKKEDDIVTLKEQLRIAENTIKVRNEQINHLTSVRSDAEKAGSGLTQESRHIFSREELIKINGETESDQLAQAANATIKTLHDMIDHKNAQLERKEIQIQKLQQDIVKVQQESVKEAHRLAQELHTRTAGSMANLQGAIDASNQRPRTQTSYRPDLDVMLQDKDNRMNHMVGQLKGAERTKDQNEKLLNQLRRELEQTKYDLNIERAKNTGEAYKKELDMTRKQMQLKDKELQGLKKSLADLKDDLLRAAESNEVKEKDFREKALREGSDNSVIAQNMAKAQQRIETLSKQMKEAREEINRLKGEKIEMAERETKSKEDSKRIIDNQLKKQEMLDKLMKENSTLKKKMEEHKEPPARAQDIGSRGTTSQAQDVKQLKDTIATLEKDKAKLTKELEKFKTQPAEVDSATEAVVRRFGNILTNKRITIEAIADNAKKVSVAAFRKNLVDKRIGLNEEEINILIQLSQQHAPSPTKSRDGQAEPGIAIKKLEKLIKNICSSQPKPRAAAELESKRINDPQPQMLSLESQRDERKYEMLNKQISMLRKEIETKDKQMSHFEGLTKRLEQEKQEIAARIELPQINKAETVTFQQIENVEELRKELFELQTQNMSLQKRVQVTIQSEIKKLQHDAHSLHEENKHLRVETINLQSQLEKVRSNRIKSVEGLREDEVYELNMKVNRLQEALEEVSQKEQFESERLLEVEAENLDMKFEKETLNLQLSRLQRRIKELDQFKNAVVKEGLKVRDEEPKTIKFMDIEHIDVKSTFLEGPVRSTKELEQVVDSLKNVIDKLRAENDLLKRTTMTSTKENDKIKNDRLLTQKIDSLEEEVRELRLREDINRDLEQKLKRVNEANESLRRDMEREIHLMDEADKKYRSLFMQYEVLQRDNDRLRRALDELTYR